MHDCVCMMDESKMSGSVSKLYEMKIVNETHIHFVILISISINSVTCVLKLLFSSRRDVGILKSVLYSQMEKNTALIEMLKAWMLVNIITSTIVLYRYVDEN